MSRTFLYFAYGSNLFSGRIHINNPSAVRVGIGKLKDYRLDFNTYSSRWKGASATIVPHKGHYVWGALWEISLQDLPHLDKQEGVDANIYYPLEVEVELPDLSVTKCRVYIQTNIPEYVEKIENLPENRKPSGTYLKTILRGAIESGLPEKYVYFLEGIPHNTFDGNVDLRTSLDIVD